MKKEKQSSKKGVFSFLYLFAISSYLLIILSIYLSIYQQTSYLENKVFILEERAGRELELKHAIKRVIIYSEQISKTKEVVKDIADTLIPEEYPLISQVFDSSYSLYGLNRLKDLQSTGSHEYYDWRRLALRFWCGYPSDNEIKDIISIQNGNPKFYRLTGILSDKIFEIDSTATIKEEVRNKCSLFLSTNANVSTQISPPADSKTLNELNIAERNSDFKFGVFVYDSKENISSAIVIPYSTEIRWDDYLGLFPTGR